MPAELIADIQVWRAATQVDPSDLRPTAQLGYATRIFQQQLDMQLADINADERWRLLATEVPNVTTDPFLPELEQRLTNLSGRLRRRCRRAAGRRRRTPTRRPPRRSPLVAHPRPATANAEPGPQVANPPRRRPPSRRHWTGSHPCRARHRLPRAARAAETSLPTAQCRSVAGAPDQHEAAVRRASAPRVSAADLRRGC